MNMMDRNIRREMPSNIDAEQALLGALMIRNDAMTAVPATFASDHFSEPLHRRIYDEMQRIIASGKMAHPVTLKAAVDDGTMVGNMTISQYLAHLAANAVTIVGVPEYANAITFFAMRRSMISVAGAAEQMGYDCSDELSFMEEADALRSHFERIMRGLEMDSEGTLAEAAGKALNDTAEAYQGKASVGVDYGFTPLMSLIGPAMPSQLIVIGGGTKQGKSSLTEQMIMGAAMNGHPVWVYSGEMQAPELAQRALSRMTDIQAWRQQRGKVSEAEYEKLMIAKRNAETWQSRVVIRDKPMTLPQIERAVENFSKRHPNGMAVIDHIGLVARDKATERLSPQDFGPVVTRTAKMLANKANLPVIALAQLKKNTFVGDDRKMDRRAYEQAINRRPKATDLIGACEQDANHVVCPFRAEPILEELRPSESSNSFNDWQAVMDTVKDKAEIILALSRHRKYPVRREVIWNGGRTMFEDAQQGDQGRFL